MGGAATSTHLKFLDDGLLEDLGRLGRLGLRAAARLVAQLREELFEVNSRLAAVGSCTCDDIATALLDSMTLERVGVVANALAHDGGYCSRLIKLADGRFRVRANATEPPLATDAFPDDDASVATAARASTDVSVAGTVAEPRLSPWDDLLKKRVWDEATRVVLEERARSGFDESDAEEDEPKRKPSVRSPQPSREDCHAAAQTNESPTAGRSENLLDGESPTAARAKDRKLEEIVDENEDLTMRDENETPPPPRRSRVRDPLPPQGQN